MWEECNTKFVCVLFKINKSLCYKPGRGRDGFTENIEIFPLEVRRLTKEGDPLKDYGPDSISPFVLKECLGSPSTKAMFQENKRANVVPVYLKMEWRSRPELQTGIVEQHNLQHTTGFFFLFY